MIQSYDVPLLLRVDVTFFLCLAVDRRHPLFMQQLFETLPPPPTRTPPPPPLRSSPRRSPGIYMQVKASEFSALRGQSEWWTPPPPYVPRTHTHTGYSQKQKGWPPFPPSQTTARLSSFVNIFLISPRFLLFSPTAEPGPRLFLKLSNNNVIWRN